MIAHTAAARSPVRYQAREGEAAGALRRDGGFGTGGLRQLDQALEDLSRPGVRMTYARDEEIYGEGEPAEFVYRILSGAVRTYRVLNDGRRQVCDFHLAGEYFGLEPGLDYRVTAEALTETTVLVTRRGALAELAQRDNEVARELWMMSARRLERSQDHVLMLGRKNASERVAGFLVDFAGRVDARDDFELPMSRQDIADYLGLTIETVSRTFSQLESLGVLKAHNSRRIHLSNRAALEDMCE
jgi:CRP/FNR family nitrogen fixation transcriptional regulator